MDRAFSTVRPRSVIDRLQEYWQTQALSEERNSLYLKARQAKGEAKEMLIQKLYDVETDLQYLHKPESFLDQTTSAVSSIARSSTRWQTLAGTVASGAITAVSGGAALPLIAAAGVRALGGMSSAYKPTYESALVEIYRNNPNISDEEAQRMAENVALPSSAIEGVGDIFGASSIAVSSFAEKGFKAALKKNIQKLTKESFKKQALKYAGKSALGAVAEGGQEIVQEGIEKRSSEKSGALSKVAGSISDVYSVLGKIVSREELTKEESELVNTFLTTSVASILFSGAVDATSNVFSLSQDFAEQKQFQRKSDAYFNARQQSNLPNDVQRDLARNQSIPQVFADAAKLKVILQEELDTSTTLSEQQIAEINNVIENCKEAISTTGVIELEGADYANLFLSPEYASLKQKTKGTFFPKANMVEGNFSSEQISMQAVKEMMPNALESESAFFDALNAIKGVDFLSDEDAIANAMQFNALANIVSTMEGKTWAEIKEERGISFDISKSLFGKEKVEGVSVKEQEIAVDELQTNLESIAEAIAEPVSQEQLSLDNIIVDEQTKEVIDGNKRVRSAKKAGVKKAKVKTVKHKDAKKLKEKKAEQYSLFQGEAGSLDYNVNQIVLRLTESANPTTFAHESFHLFDVLMGDLYAKEKLTPFWKKQYEKMYKGVGEKLSDIKNLEKSREFLAESWERYLMEGVAPKKELEGLFARFKAMFAKMYESLVRTKKLNKSVREVFDSIFLTQREAEIALRAINVGAMKKPENISDETYSKYVSAKHKATTFASNKTINAIRKATKEIRNSDEYKNAEAELRQEIEAELAQQQQFVVQNAVQSEKLPSGMTNPKINVTSLSSSLKGLSHIKGITNNQNKGMSLSDYVFLIRNELGLDISENTFVGYITGNTLEQEAQERLDLAMTEWLQTTYPDLYEQMKAYNNIQNIDAVDAVIYEYIFAKGLEEQSFGETKVLIEKAVNDILSKTPLKEIAKRKKYQDMLLGNVLRQKNASETSAEFANLKLNQAIIMKVLEKAKEAEKKKAKFEEYFKKYKKTPDKQDVKKIDAYSFDLIKSLAGKSGLEVGEARESIDVQKKLSSWIEDKNAKGFVNSAEAFDVLHDFVSQDKSYFDWAYNDFILFDTTIRDLEKFAKNLTSAEVKNEKFIYEEDAREWVNNLKEVGYKNSKSIVKKLAQYGMVYPRLFAGLMPERLNIKYLNKLVTGWFEANKWKNERAQIFADIIGEEKSKLSEYLSFDINGTKVNLTREQVLVLMFHSGTAHNSLCAIKTIANNPEMFGLYVNEDLSTNEIGNDLIRQANDVYKNILENAPKNFQEITNGIWEELDRHKEDFKKGYFESEGMILKLKNIEHFKFKGSILKEGLGYFPALSTKYDMENEIFRRQFSQQNGYFAPNSSKDADENAHGNLELSLGVLNEWTHSIGDYIYIAPSWNNFSRLLNQPTVENAFDEYTYKGMKEWLRGFVRSESVNTFIRALDSFANYKILSADIIKALRQFSGIFFTASDVGFAETVSALGEYISNPILCLSPIKSASKLSAYMEQRYSDPVKYLFAGYDSEKIYEEYGKTIERSKNVFEKTNKLFMSFITIADAMTSYVTWKASFNKALAEGKSNEDASYLADRTVMLTQGDGSIVNRPEAIKGAYRFLTKYSTFFFSVQSSLLTDIVFQKNRKALNHATLTIVNVIILGAMYEVAINQLKKKKTEDDDDEFLTKTTKASIHTAFNVAAPYLGLGGKLASAVTENKTYSTRIPLLSIGDNFAKLINDWKEERFDDSEIISRITKEALPNAIVSLLSGD